jgi:predicted nucleotidyltransferase
MQIQRPFALLTPTIDGDVLAVLARAEREFTPPEVHHLIGEHSVDGVRKALRRLADQGIVLQRRAGQAILYQLNREHLIAPAVATIAGFRELLLQRMRSEIESWRTATPFAALFGSAAAGAMRTDSDIDIFIVRPNRTDPDDSIWRSQLDTLSRHCTNWTGNDARVLEYADKEVADGLARNDPVLSDIQNEGLRLTGPSGYLRRPRERTR